MPIPEKNTPELWDKNWSTKPAEEDDRIRLAREELSIRFRRIEQVVRNHFGGFKGLRVIEIGAGTGTNALLFASRGATVTILDFSPKALDRSRLQFARHNLPASFVQADALNLPQELRDKFDIAMSFGLSEHFSGTNRFSINKAHFELIRTGGLVFISVPNSLNLPYRIFKRVAELRGTWEVGEEYPYTRGELKKICSRLGVKDLFFIGDSLISSFNFVNPGKVLKKVLRKKKPRRPLRPEKGTFLDQFFSYALVLCAGK